MTIKKRIISVILCLFMICTAAASCGSPQKMTSSASILKEQNAFDQYTDGLFVKEMKENTVNLHYTLANPDKFGIKSHKISLGRLSEDQMKSSIASLENITAVLSNFDYDALTTKQQLTYDILMDYCQKELLTSSLYYYSEPLRPTTGTHSELPVLLAEYAFYEPSDVTDYLSLLICIEDYFKQIAAFEQEKSKKGLFMPDYAAEDVMEACKAFATDPKKNYLIDTFNSKLESVSEIPEEKKELYKKENQSLVENIVISSYKMLSDVLGGLKGTGNNSSGLCYYPKGREYYEYLVRSNTGSEKSVKELIQMTQSKRDQEMEKLHKQVAKNPGLIRFADPKITAEEPETMLNHLLEAMQEDFYPAADSSFEINYIHKSLEETLAPAFYLTAPIDNISHNVIYLNKSSQYSGIRLFTTLAHEGYPGHLYQTTGSYQAGLIPIRAILNYPGYVEGWATYVEMLSYQYAGLKSDLADLLRSNQSALLSLYASVDMGIHYEGWKLEDTAVFMKKYGIRDSKTIQGIYELIVEEPSHYLKYYVGYLEFLELKEYAKQELKEKYSDRAFHQAVLRIGPAPFPILKKYLKKFYSSENDALR